MYDVTKKNARVAKRYKKKIIKNVKYGLILILYSNFFLQSCTCPVSVMHMSITSCFFFYFNLNFLAFYQWWPLNVFFLEKNLCLNCQRDRKTTLWIRKRKIQSNFGLFRRQKIKIVWRGGEVNKKYHTSWIVWAFSRLSTSFTFYRPHNVYSCVCSSNFFF